MRARMNFDVAAARWWHSSANRSVSRRARCPSSAAAGICRGVRPSAARDDCSAVRYDMSMIAKDHRHRVPGSMSALTPSTRCEQIARPGDHQRDLGKQRPTSGRRTARHVGMRSRRRPPSARTLGRDAARGDAIAIANDPICSSATSDTALDVTVQRRSWSAQTARSHGAGVLIITTISGGRESPTRIVMYAVCVRAVMSCTRRRMLTRRAVGRCRA